MMLNFRFYHFKSLASTNIKAKEYATKGFYNLIIIADKQTKGKGRFKRKWNSGVGGLYMTIVLKVDDLDKTKYLTFIASLSVAKTIRKFSSLNALVKWPNDVLVNDKKICGILTETISGRKNYVLVGIGLNINQKKFSKNFIHKATSLKIETNRDYNIEKIITKITKNFNELYKQYKNKNYKKIINIWKEYSHTLGKKVKAKTLRATYYGRAIDIDNECNLLVKLKNGKIKKIMEGDVFVV